MMKTKITVAVSGLNNVDSPGPGIPVVRGLRESTFFEPRIVGLVYENLEPGAYMHDHVDKSYKVPYPSEGSGILMERIRDIHAKESIDVLIPNFDSELYTFMKAESELKHLGIHTFLPTLQQFEERHKSNLPEFGEKYKIKVPKSRPITRIQELKELEEDYDYPMVIKGKFYDASIAFSFEQAQIYFNKIASKWGLPIVVQEYIRGTEVNVVALGDGRGNTIGAVPMKKQYITDKGKAWGGITLDDPKMLELTHDIIGQTHWRGGMELELIRTDKKELYLIEINPRLPAWVYLAVGAGQNLPEALVKLALGYPVEPFTDYTVGILFIRYSYDMICPLGDFQSLTTRGEL
ncbi:ATP-grasp domain-containing protein [Fidelibacter multiformis]|jgi:carbamoyl-phosphate synthase large subunit|uniref:ATP-grasp domain-containing protein n=1 Tax=Fidelibacter multiformis TaxID=3377529 RepID=UPI0037DC4A22